MSKGYAVFPCNGLDLSLIHIYRVGEGNSKRGAGGRRICCDRTCEVLLCHGCRCEGIKDQPV